MYRDISRHTIVLSGQLCTFRTRLCTAARAASTARSTVGIRAIIREPSQKSRCQCSSGVLRHKASTACGCQQAVRACESLPSHSQWQQQARARADTWSELGSDSYTGIVACCVRTAPTTKGSATMNTQWTSAAVNDHVLGRQAPPTGFHVPNTQGGFEAPPPPPCGSAQGSPCSGPAEGASPVPAILGPMTQSRCCMPPGRWARTRRCSAGLHRPKGLHPRSLAARPGCNRP
jgi:hypothetical protein